MEIHPTRREPEPCHGCIHPDDVPPMGCVCECHQDRYNDKMCKLQSVWHVLEKTLDGKDWSPMP